MRTFLRSPAFPQWNAHSPQVRELLGLAPTAKLPPEGMSPRVIQGIVVWVNPLPPRGAHPRFKRSTHRVMAQCPACSKVLSAGRLHQHVCREEGS
jgi:hypothetical protein